jgi:hypothetical protein
VDPGLFLQLWDRLLPQAEMTLNLLRTSRQHPHLSAAAHYHGMIDYNKSDFAPSGYNIIAHEKPSQRRTLALHGQHGYSLGTAMHHYRCQNVYITSTASKRIVAAENCGCCLDLRSKFKVIAACGKNLSHKCNGKSGLTEAKPATKCSLKVRIACSAALHLWQWDGTS